MSRPIKGLMIKDLRLVFSQMKLFFVIMAVWGIFMAVNIEQFYFVPAYTAVFCTFISLSTYSYDEFENGTAYLFTLPIRRRDYVRAKYLLGILFMMVPTIVITFAACVAGMVTKGEAAVWEYFAATVTSIGIALVLLAVENPLYIRFQAGQFWHYRRRLGGDWLAGRGISRWYERHQQHIGAGFVDAHAADGGS